MKTRKSMLVIAITLIAWSLLPACSKKDAPGRELDTASATEAAKMQAAYDEALLLAQDAMETNPAAAQKAADPCLTASLDTAANLLTLDFGSTNCLGADGQYRRGKIIIHYIGPYREPGSEMTVTLDDYHLNDDHIEGTLSVSSFYRDEHGYLAWTVGIAGGRITWSSDQSTSAYSGSKTWKWTAGEGSQNLEDDVFEITGQSQGATREGDSFAAQIIQPLVFKSSCFYEHIVYPVSGQLQITTGSQATRAIDFGSGSCDRQVRISTSASQRDLELR